MVLNLQRGVSVVCQGPTELLVVSQRACEKLGLRAIFQRDLKEKVQVLKYVCVNNTNQAVCLCVAQ